MPLIVLVKLTEMIIPRLYNIMFFAEMKITTKAALERKFIEYFISTITGKRSGEPPK